MGLFDEKLNPSIQNASKLGTALRVVPAVGAGVQGYGAVNKFASGDYLGGGASTLDAISTGAMVNPAFVAPALAFKAGFDGGALAIGAGADAYYNNPLQTKAAQKDAVFQQYYNAKSPSDMKAIYMQRKQEQDKILQAQQQEQDRLRAIQEAQQAQLANLRTVNPTLVSALGNTLATPTLNNNFQNLDSGPLNLQNLNAVANNQRNVNKLATVIGSVPNAGAGLAYIAKGATDAYNNITQQNVDTADRNNKQAILTRQLSNAEVQANNENIARANQAALQQFQANVTNNRLGVDNAVALNNAQQNANAIANQYSQQIVGDALNQQYFQARQQGDNQKAAAIADLIGLRSGKIPTSDFKTVTVKDQKGGEETQIFDPASGTLRKVQSGPVLNADNTVTIPGSPTPMPRDQFERIRKQLGY